MIYYLKGRYFFFTWDPP